MEIQAGSHNGDLGRFTQWRSKDGSHNGDPKPVRTMEIQAGSHNVDPSRFTQWRYKAGSHNGDPSRFTQWRSKAGSHNGDPRRRRRRRRCGPPVGRPRGTSPWCPPALHGLESDREGGFTPTRPAKHHGGGSPLRLLPLSLGPRYVHAPALHVAGSPPRGTEWGARRSAGFTSGTVHHPPREGGRSLTGVGP